ncbi:MAG: universal stress protein [Spirochaetales bacterium]|nr:universal stress protein [Leptospiraceae bacterium]MCP5481639.1 universal stress protein [Spirochaetales bacterium]MCP5484467.1 universal stress protein [Spirochaetales bacterium]
MPAAPDIYFAYDGSLNGDWVARYAIRAAARMASRKLHIVHVLDGRLPEGVFNDRLIGLERECKARDVDLQTTIVPRRAEVAASIVEQIPAGPGSLLYCGTRARSRRGFIAGTVAARLLKQSHCHTIAVRVVNPGLLGDPRDVLLPLSGRSDTIERCVFLAELFLPDLDSIHLLRVATLSGFSFHYLTRKKAAHLKREINEWTRNAAAALRDQLQERCPRLDYRAQVSDDWTREILVQANKLKARMILMGASDRSLPGRYLHGNLIERVLRETSSDVGIYRLL